MRIPIVSTPLRFRRTTEPSLRAPTRARPDGGHLRLAIARVSRGLRPAASAAVLPVAPQAIGSGAVQPQSLSSRELRSRVWTLALPAIGEQVLALGVGVSDTFLSGHMANHASAVLGYGRATALASVGVAATAVWVILTAFFAVNIGVTALVARAVGAKDRDLAARTAAQGIVLGAVAGVAMVLVAVPLADLLTQALGVSGQVAVLAASFIRVYSIALPAVGITSACTAAMRGASDPRRPLAIMVIVNGTNIVASWTLLNGVPSLGIAPIGVVGSATGAALGWALGAVLAIVLLSRSHPRAPRLHRKYLRPDIRLIKRILNIGLPSAAELVVFQIGIVSFLRIVVPLGADTYAANTSINTIESIGSLPGFGFAVAATALVGQALGARDPELAVRVVWAALRPCLAIMGTLGLIALVVPHLLLGTFIADANVIRAGDTAMRLSILTMPPSALAFVFIGALRGAGDTKFPVIVRATGTWGIRVPLALFLIPMLALPGARIAMACDFWTQAGITYLRFRSGKWRKLSV